MWLSHCFSGHTHCCSHGQASLDFSVRWSPAVGCWGLCLSVVPLLWPLTFGCSFSPALFTVNQPCLTLVSERQTEYRIQWIQCFRLCCCYCSLMSKSGAKFGHANAVAKLLHTYCIDWLPHNDCIILVIIYFFGHIINHIYRTDYTFSWAI